MARWSYSFVCTPHYLIIIIMQDLPESIELLKRLSGTFYLECVSKIMSILAIIFYAIYGAVRIQFTRFSYEDFEDTRTLSYYHQIGSMTHLPLCRVRSWNKGMCCMSFYIILTNFGLIVSCSTPSHYLSQFCLVVNFVPVVSHCLARDTGAL